MSEEKKDFVIKDRRLFSQEEPVEKEPEGKPAAAQAEAKGRSEEQREEEPGPEPTLPEINFATFILSLHSSALMHLGMMESPSTRAKAKNMVLAKQTIDILGILEEKTRGNLEHDEENLLKNILHDLRLAYVKEKV